jgi:tRNA threonylcarbamoyladenosine biosynthesis protein TsaE
VAGESVEPLVIATDSADATARLGALVGALLRAGDTLGLAGELGAGKTVFTKGLATGVGVPPRDVRSQTFTLVARHEGGRVPLVHVDAYRLSGAQDLIDLGYEEIFAPDAAAVIEWSPRVTAALPPERVEILIEHAGESARRLRLEAVGARGRELLAAVRAKVASEPKETAWRTLR